MNVELLEKVKAAILAHPENYNQDEWCGTAQCIAGHGALINDPKEYEVQARQGGGVLLGYVCEISETIFDLTEAQKACLFHSENWPGSFFDDYDRASNKEERAQIAAARIDHLIATGE